MVDAQTLTRAACSQADLNRRSPMKKSKLIFSAFVLALTLAFTSIASTNVYADDGDPQGAVETKKAPPPPPPPPKDTFAAIWDWFVRSLS